MRHSFGDTLPVLLEVKLQDDSLTVRIDNDFYKLEFSGNKSITEITITNCKNATEAFETLNELLGSGLLAYEIENNVVTFAPEFGFAELKIFCQKVKQSTTAYKKADLEKRCIWLAKDYEQFSVKYGEACLRHNRLVNDLKNFLANSIDRWERKADFFETRDSVKTSALRAHIEAYQRILRIVQEPPCS